MIFATGVLCLEQQDQFGRQIRDAVSGAVDDVAVGKPDPLISSADPGVAVVRFAEHVEQVVAGGRIAEPSLMYGASTSGMASSQIRPLPTASKTYPGKR
ncbi:hypothetical protein AQJ58_07210 [Streptomyces sp. DSM 15324]|nr:hypothetical protein AQJ58_07210 [Streptomyces sp. DSM 15324]